MIYRLRRRLFTFYDETDNLKRMKDSDILAEKKKPTTGLAAKSALGSGLVGAGMGAAGGAALGAGLSAKAAYKAAGSSGLGSTTSILSSAGKASLKGAKIGAVVGGLGAALVSYNKSKGQVKENSAYNNRLKYAQKQALRRERKDWKTNMTQREGYSY